MEPEEMSKSISECKNEIDKLNQKINEIRNQCKHKDYDVKLVGSNAVEVKKICKICNKDLGYPNNIELKNAGF
jgi:peptidoglycan hydrolase CwlO-like protein